jgi:hypothetical protein
MIGPQGLFDMGHGLTHMLLLVIAFLLFQIWDRQSPAPQTPQAPQVPQATVPLMALQQQTQPTPAFIPPPPLPQPPQGTQAPQAMVPQMVAPNQMATPLASLTP